MDFKTFFLLKESNDNDPFYSWINPSGEIFSVKDWGGKHVHFATEYLSQHPEMKQEFRKDPDKDLYLYFYKKGWCRVMYVGDLVYMENTKRKPNNKQISVMTNLCIERGKDRLVYDGLEDSIPLWERDKD